ncbi:MAG: hypothetical protein K2X57_06465 [Xanthobacteraceae bacterium]|nr:hypothetical protein [Xanthobacteraceae bacterium]
MLLQGWVTVLKEAQGRMSDCKKRCAAQAEYGRLAAQAYSPSDAMSQARICLAGIQKVQHGDEQAGAFTSHACPRI